MNSPSHKDDSLWLKQWRGFFYTLIAVFIIWLVSDMSEEKAYIETYNIDFVGLDTTKYAITDRDSTITLELKSNGFRTLRRSLEKQRTLHIYNVNLNENEEQIGFWNINVEEILSIITPQLDMRGVSTVRGISKQLSLKVTRRESKAFVPDISQVNFVFEGMCGLSGKPEVRPDTVWLYGSRKSLEQIDKISASPQNIRHIFRSGTYRVKLDPRWKEMSDLYPSVTEVEIYLPVESFIEKTVKVPIKAILGDGIKRVHLYPDEVTVHFMIPHKAYDEVGSEDFEVTATMQEDSSTLHPIATKFPSNVKITEIEPAEVQYIVISE